MGRYTLGSLSKNYETKKNVFTLFHINKKKQYLMLMTIDCKYFVLFLGPWGNHAQPTYYKIKFSDFTEAFNEVVDV